MVHPHSNLTRQIDNIEIDVSALAAVTGVTGASRIDGNREMGFRTLMQRGCIDFKPGTPAVGGPMLVGFAENGLTLAQIEEAIENDPQADPDPVSKVLNEQARRKIFVLGYASSQLEFQFTTFSRRHKWSYPEGTAMLFFAYNTDLNTAIAASSTIQIFCEHIGVWLRD